MTTPTNVQTKNYLEILKNLLGVLGSIAGISGLLIAIVVATGFVIINSNLGRYGTYELAIVRNEYIAAGTSFIILSLTMIFIGSTIVQWIHKDLKSNPNNTKLTHYQWAIWKTSKSTKKQNPWKRFKRSNYVEVILIYLLSIIVSYLCIKIFLPQVSLNENTQSAVTVQNFVNITGDSLFDLLKSIFLGAVMLSLIIGIFVSISIIRNPKNREKWRYRLSNLIIGGTSLVLLIFFKYLIGWLKDGQTLIKEYQGVVFWGWFVAISGGIYFKYYLDKNYPEFWNSIATGSLDFAKIGKPLLGTLLLLLFALVTYGKFAYAQLPKSWGGGNPIYVQFVVKEEGKPLLKQLGLEVGDDGLTELVVFLAEADDQIYVATTYNNTFAFDPKLVSGAKFYSNHHFSADRHFNSAEFFRKEGDWQNAIREYKAALAIKGDSTKALIGRGVVYTQLFIEEKSSIGEEGNSQDSTTKNFNNAKADFDKAEQLGGDKVPILYHRGLLLYFHSELDENEVNNDVWKGVLGDAKTLDPAYRKEILKNIYLRNIFFPKEGDENYNDLRGVVFGSNEELANNCIQVAQDFIDQRNLEEATFYINEAIELAKLNHLVVLAEAYYNQSRIYAIRGDHDAAIKQLEKAIWLNRELVQKAQEENDFDVLKENSNFELALSPPKITNITANVESNEIVFSLEVPRDNFSNKVNVLLEILGEEIVIFDEVGQNGNHRISADNKTHTIQLGGDRQAEELAVSLNQLLKLVKDTTLTEG